MKIDMSLKQVLLIILLGSGILISMNALNSIFYSEVTLLLGGQVIAGPVVALLFLNGKHRKYRAKIIILILVFAGISGILHIGADVARLYIYEKTLPYTSNNYFLHGLMNIVYLVVSYIWYRKLEKN